jgi:hypothetical protein
VKANQNQVRSRNHKRSGGSRQSQIHFRSKLKESERRTKVLHVFYWREHARTNGRASQMLMWHYEGTGKLRFYVRGGVQVNGHTRWDRYRLWSEREGLEWLVATQLPDCLCGRFFQAIECREQKLQEEQRSAKGARR